jgi:hypothetical protein
VCIYKYIRGVVGGIETYTRKTFQPIFPLFIFPSADIVGLKHKKRLKSESCGREKENGRGE